MNDIITTAEQAPPGTAYTSWWGMERFILVRTRVGWLIGRHAELATEKQLDSLLPIASAVAWRAATEPARVLPSREELADILRTHNIERTGLGEVSCQGCRDRGWMPWHVYRQHVADAVLDLFANAPTVEQVKAEALREHRRRVVRFMPTGLVNRATVLADLDDYADRLAPTQPVPDVPEVGLPTPEVPNVGGEQHV